jgi:hypothetical protein
LNSHKFSKHLTINSNGVNIEELRIGVNKGEEVLLSHQRSGGHGATNVSINPFKGLGRTT